MPARQNAAVALVLVLAFIVLLSFLVLAFFSSVQTNLISARSYASGVTARHLAESTINLAMSQIIDGTKSRDKPNGTALSWASQPGLIHTWDDQGNPNRTYKLYSSANMVEPSGKEFLPSGALQAEVPATWPASPALYTDLNSPVLVLDATGVGQIKGRDGKTYYADYPIVDPLAQTDSVEGFSITNAPGSTGVISATADPTLIAPKTTANPAPMPVVWMYMLKDGTLLTPDATSTTTATFTSAPNPPSQANPIVGRIAFWTDDESCKININTASEPTPWDTPRAVLGGDGQHPGDLQYGKFQPAFNEFQRFPGHPATVALSPVLFPSVNPAAMTQLTPAQKAEIYSIVPRVQDGGSKSGSIAFGSAGPVPLDSDRLFASVDELLFEPSRTALTNDSNFTNQFTKFNTAPLKRARFFLTANSRAPELNLFGLPRVSLWPINTASTLRSPYDRLSAFCTTIGDPTGNAANRFAYYFQRSDPTSPTNDYLNIPRNQILYKYLQQITGRTGKNIPGFGGNFTAKWGADCDQVLTEIMDYIRCTNLRDPQGAATAGALGPYAYSSNGQVAPLFLGVNNTQGFGRFHTLSQFGMHFICSQDGPDGQSTVDNTAKALPSGQKCVQAAFLMEPFSPSEGWYQINENLYITVTFLKPMKIDDQDLKMSSNSVAMSNAIGNGWHCNGRQRGGAGGLRGPMQAFGGGGYKFMSQYTAGTSAAPTVPGVITKNPTMVFSGGPIQVGVYSGNSAAPANLVQTFILNFPGGTFPVPKLVKTGTDDYRPGGLATGPSYWWTFKSRYASLGVTPHAPGAEYTDPARRWTTSGGPPGFKKGGIFRQEDVVRSIVPEHGDIRIIAAQRVINDTATGPDQFVPVDSKLWNDASTNFLHVFSEAVGTHTIFGNCNEPTTGGVPPATGLRAAAPDDQLISKPGIQYHYSRLPEIRPGAGKIYNQWNDFDNGVAQSTDGAFINKPDEGDTATTTSSFAYFSWDFTEQNIIQTFFSPNRLVPSAGMLGSLPTGVKRQISTPTGKHAWETLLFRPELNHPGAGLSSPPGVPGPPYTSGTTPPDHLIMDLFWMPVLEPYAISEAFSTAGKVNMNYEIAPFTYIRRATAVHAAMKSESPLAIPNAASKIYKLWDHETNDFPLGLPNTASDQDARVSSDWNLAFNGLPPFDKVRRPIFIDDSSSATPGGQNATLTQFEDHFKNYGVFRSATQICDLHLVREGERLSNYQNGLIWPNYLPTGDNTRERPYANLYAKLTTKSNAFTVHFRVQVLEKNKTANGSYAQWTEGTDQVVSDYRGSSVIERYIDAEASLPDFAANQNTPMDDYYRFRVVSTKKFAP